MSLPYEILGEYTGSVESASFLSSKDTSLLYVSNSVDIWFSLSTNDTIEIGSFSTDDQTPVSWGVLYQDKDFQTVNLTYIDYRNVPYSYSYNQLVNPFTLHGNDSILLQPSLDLNNIGITEGSYVVSYNFTREMAGTPSSSLTIKDISPSRTEVKLIPSNTADIQYNSFCVKKFPIRDVAPVLLSLSKDISYDRIYKEMSHLNQYDNGISFLKFMFFLTDDGSIINFLKNLYEDDVKYTSTTPTLSQQSTTIIRIQGIKTYYNNFLLQNYSEIADFNDIENRYIDFVNVRLTERFKQFANQTDQGYKDARQFCYDFFVTYFYSNNVHPLQISYENKYFGYLKNVLNFGNNKYFTILDVGYIDERTVQTDAITLILKLSTPLPSDISIKDACWVSNFGMIPYTFTVILQNPVKYQTVKISPPNFGSPQYFINKEDSNTLYSSDDLLNTSTVEANSITVNKNIAELNTDYTDYNKFIVFSSAKTRLNIFKSKIIQWTTLSASLVELDRRYNTALSSSTPYQYYFTEKASFTQQITDIVNSFDGFESFLFNGGKYQYVLQSGSFYNASYVADEDLRASEYDLNNRDSLIANVPQYITSDSSNYYDYLTFLNMIGHHFDNIYTYISAMPIERQVRNELTSSIPTNTLKEMLYSFGWKVEDIIGSLDIDEVYLNSMNVASFDALSGQQRLQTIWNRILISLPGIYKTKGTEQCVNYLMACYGLPTSMITIREYGGTDFAGDTSPTYELDEKTYLLKFSGVGDCVEGPIPYSTKTTEFKFSIDTDSTLVYPNFKFFPLFTSIPYPYSSSANFNWTLGFYRVPGQYTGKVVFQMGSGSSGVNITSSVLPIFNGDIFSVMLRRDYPNSFFEPAIDPNVIPLEYDLTVQRNENGRKIFYSTSSVILYDDDNDVFSQFGRFRLTNGTFKGTLDKLSIWDVPLDDTDFEEHVNDLNSYGYSGSIAYQSLWVRLNWDYPQSMFSISSSAVWVNNDSPYYTIPNYYTDQTLTTINPSVYSASLTIISQSWQTYYPTGSVEIRAYNFPEAIGNAFSASFIGYPTCQWFSQSIYPYHFKELTYQQNIDASKFGPTKYKNKKIKTLTYDVNARFDVYDRSTSNPDVTVSGESNQLGFFIDPQDSKNKDILRYVGRSGIMNLIGDPANLYSDKYGDLINKNHEYNSNGNKRTYFNELLTVYKFYFDKSIFQAIQNVVPARANVYTGVVIEPTLLERSKYQNKPMSGNLDRTSTTIDNIYTFDMNILWASSMTESYQHTIDLNYIMDPTIIRPANVVDSGYYTDYMDKIQHSFYPDFELLIRNWETSSTGPLPSSYTVPIYGSVTHQDDDDRFMIGLDHGVNYSNKFFSGFNQGNHPILYYMMKVWDKYYYYAKTGNYIRSDNPSADPYSSASFYLYKYVILDEHYMRNLIYFTDKIYLPMYNSGSDISYTYDSILGYAHKANTFLNTPDQTISNIRVISTDIHRLPSVLGISSGSQYFELVSGYPRNHYSHKLQQFSKIKYGTYNNGLFVKGQQTTDSTIDTNGINNGSLPVETTATSNINVVNSSNVIQSVPSSTVTTGQITPTRHHDWWWRHGGHGRNSGSFHHTGSH